MSGSPHGGSGRPDDRARSSRMLQLGSLLQPEGAGSALVPLVVLATGAVLVPVLLVVLLAVVVPAPGSWLLGLVLGVVVDLLVAALLLGFVTHRATSRGLRDHRRLLRTIEARTARQGAALRRQEAALRRQADTRSALETAVTSLGNRLQATQNLFAMVTPQGPVPSMVGYVASPDVLLVLVQKFLALRPSLTIECGSGTSTLFLALAAQQHGVTGRIVSLEHQAAYAESTRALLAEHGVDHLVDVRHAPLTPVTLPDHEGSWYDPAALEDLHDVGLAFVDGPPGTGGPQARYPMVPLLVDRLASTCVIVLDDANRKDERGVTERWTTQLDGFSHRFLPLTRGAGLFERGVQGG